MKDNFEKGWAFTFGEEGPPTNDPDDPGGDTKWGIARNMHPEITGAQWAAWTKDDSKRVARAEYWAKAGCDTLPSPLDILVFDACFNMGRPEALALLQEARKRPGDDTVEYLFFRIRHYSDKVKKVPAKIKYFRGWVNRVLDLFDIVDPA